MKSLGITLLTIIVITGIIYAVILGANYNSNIIKNPQINITGLDSTNWAGYAVETDFNSPAENSVDFVSAYWNITKVGCMSPSMDYASSFWVGIDGLSTMSIDQIGTDSECVNGSPAYFPWYEIYPNESVSIDMTIKPGDEIYAEVKSIGEHRFQLTITNLKTSDTFTTIQEDADSKRFSAEVIAEAPYLENKSIIALADFGPVEFYNISTTINNQSGTIEDPKWQYQRLIMIDPAGRIKATPTTLLDNGRKFYVFWERSN